MNKLDLFNNLLNNYNLIVFSENNLFCNFPDCYSAYSSKNPRVKEDFIFVLDTDTPGYYCKAHATFCSNCQYAVTTSNVYQSNQETLCKKCYFKLSHTCDECGRVDYTETTTDPQDPNKKLCKDCFNEFYEICPNCKNAVEPDELKDDDRNRFHRSNKNSPTEGCTNCFSKCYGCAHWMDNTGDEGHIGPDERFYCSECYSETFTYCEECHSEVTRDDSYYIEADSIEVCSSCFRANYGICHQCRDVTPQQNLHEIDGESYCEECRPNWDEELPQEYDSLEKPESITFSKYDRHISQLLKLLPISVKQLKQNNPRLADSLKDLIIFSKGKDLTTEVVENFMQTQSRQDYEIGYTTWRSDLQRSVKSELPQLVLNIAASSELLEKMRSLGILDLFQKINETSKSSGHPYMENQIGWARLELDPNKNYILVDEIQTDHMNALDRINKESYGGEVYKDHIKRRFNLSDEQWQKMCDDLREIIKDFPDVAVQVITLFARQNGFKQIFWHTYESGKQLKRNMPPRSLYEAVPKKHYFSPTKERPFDLAGDFLAREARLFIFNKLIGKLNESLEPLA